MKTYDLVKQLLEQYEELRNSDKKLIWSVWYRLGLIEDGFISKDGFYQAPSTESIRRCRQKLQELHPELGATAASVKKKRKQKEDTKGTFIFREKINN